MPNKRPGKSLLEDEVWIVLLERYVRGETSTALGLEFGVSPSAIAWQARNRGYRKRNRPDAVYRWHRPPPIAAHEDRAGNLAFDLDPADPGGSAGRALAKAVVAAGEGRIEDGLKLSEAARSVVRTARVMGLGGGALRAETRRRSPNLCFRRGKLDGSFRGPLSCLHLSPPIWP